MSEGRFETAPAAAAPAPWRPLAWVLSGIHLPLLIGAAALAVYPLIFSSPYSLQVLATAGVYALLVIGYQFIFGQAGALSLAQGTFFGLGAYVTGILGSQLGWSFLQTFPLSLLTPALLAIVVAAPVLKLDSHYFALATLGIGQVVLLIAINWEAVTGGANGLPGVPGVVIFGTALARGYPVLLFVWGLVALGALLAWQMTRGLYGRGFQSMRDNAVAAQAVGIDIRKLRFVAFVLSAVYGGAAGALSVHIVGVISPETLEFPIMVAALTMAVIGGRARIAGAILGAVVLIHLPEWLRGLEQYYLMAYGAGALAMIIVAPAGLIGALEGLRARLFPELPPPPPPPLALPARARPRDDTTAPLLAVAALSKSFGGVRAVDGIDFVLERGEILGLIGPNGSGKTTLVNMITGLYVPESGRIRFAGRDIAGRAPHLIAREGVARTFQNVNLVDDMTALDNVAIARIGAERAGLRAALTSWGADRRLARARGHAMALLAALGADDVAMRACGALPYGTKRRIEIARALALEPALILLDEPAAGLNESEQADLARRLEDLAGSGLTLLVIEHNMPFLMPLAQRLICLDYGRVIAAGTADEIRRDPKVIAAYLGAPADAGATP